MRSTNTRTRILRSRNKRLHGRVLIRCILSLSLAIAMTPIALADFEPSSTPSASKPENIASNGTRATGYNPPTNPSSPSESGTTGTRSIGARSNAPSANPSSPSESGTTGKRGGCTGETETVLTALAPYKHTGQTISTHPTFAWFVPDSQSFPMEVRLYRYDTNGGRELLQTMELQSVPGIMKQSLPEDKPGLSVGERYLWQVVIFCDRNQPSGNLVTEAEIDVVEMPADLETALATTTDSIERAKLYAEAGVWYDAIAEALGTPESTRTREYVLGLLDDLIRVEEPEPSENANEQSQWLREILAIERQQNSSQIP